MSYATKTYFGDVLTSRKYVTEFEVELTNAHNKTYLLNQLVEGVVRLNLKRPLEIRGQFSLLIPEFFNNTNKHHFYLIIVHVV